MNKIVGAFVTLAVASSLCGGELGETANRFRITVDSVMEVNGKKGITANAEIQYTWTKKRNDRTLTFNLMGVRAGEDGVDSMNVTMSRKKIRIVTAAEDKEIPFEDTTATQQAMLKDSFDSPICVVRVDETGKELKRTMVAGPGAKQYLDGGQIVNAFLFHPPFLQDQAKWESPAEMVAGPGALARGNLTYQKKAADKTKVTVDVAGVLTSKFKKQLNDASLVQETRLVVKGQQVYDLGRREWISGNFMIDAKMDFTPDKGAPIMGKGTMNVSFAHVSPR